MRSLGIAVLLMLCASLVSALWLEEGAAQPPIVVPSPTSRSPLMFKQISLEVKVLNATYAEFEFSASILNNSNQTLPYVIEVSTSTGYATYYLFAPSSPLAKQVEFGVEVTSEKLGRLNVKVDRSTATAFSSLEAGSEDRIDVDGWAALTQIRHLIWREYVEKYMSFSFRPEIQYEGPALASETDLEVMFSYPAEYTRTDEANYEVEIADGYKLVRYSERFYGGYGLSFSLYKPRIPVGSLIVFSALWILLIAVVIAIRRRHLKD